MINSVPWMSGLVSGLQNHVRRFESARNLGGSLEVVCNERFEAFLFCPFVTLAGLSGGSLFSWLP